MIEIYFYAWSVREVTVVMLADWLPKEAVTRTTKQKDPNMSMAIDTSTIRLD